MKRVKVSILLLLLMFTTFAANAQDTANCEAPDFSGVQEQIAAANAALEAGDLSTSLQARDEASQLCRQKTRSACQRRYSRTGNSTVEGAN